MDFGSQHVYDYACSDDEVIAEDDFSNPLYASDDDEDYDLPVPPPPPPVTSLTDTDFLANIAAPSSGRSVSPPADRRRSSRSSRLTAFTQALETISATPQPPVIPQPPRIPKCKKKHVTWDIEERALSAVPPSTSKIHKIRKADTNVLSVNFRTLKEPSDVFTGEAELCTNCRSVFSHLSVLINIGEDSDKLWVCEYCGHENTVDLMPEEIPKENDVTFMLLPPTTSDTCKPSANQSLLIFCVDISGSMAATTEIPGTYQLKEDPSLEELLKELGLTRQEYQQQIMHMRPAVTYLSRLKSLQSAVQSQLDQLTTTDPDKRVAIITFNNEVSLLGDGTKEALILAGDKLYEEERLFDCGANFQLPDVIRNTNQKISQTLWSLRDSGQTALGPALVCAIAMASRGPPGSQVIICTDGLANIGVGQLEDISTPDKLMEAQTYYEHIAKVANEKGVTVSVLTIAGAECRILELGQVADKTNGEVERVNPVDLMEGFSSILAKPILATNVSIRLTLHSKLYLREPGQSDSSWVERNVGNVTEDSELTFEYGIRKKLKLETELTPQTEPLIVLEPEPIPTLDPEPMTTLDPEPMPNLDPEPMPNLEPEPMPNLEPEPIVVSEPTSDSEVTPKETDPTPKELGATGGVTRKSSSLVIEGKEHLPFQLQISYIAKDGSKCLRVITQAMPVTKNREEAEKTSNLEVLQTHVIRSTADMALKGDFSNPRLKCLSNQKMVYRIGNNYNRKKEYRAWSSNVAQTENSLFSAQKQEEATFGRRLSDSGGDSDDELDLFSGERSSKKLSKSAKKAKKVQIRASTTMSDTFSQNLYKAKKKSCK